jgi:hypothetical protein
MICWWVLTYSNRRHSPLSPRGGVLGARRIWSGALEGPGDEICAGGRCVGAPPTLTFPGSFTRGRAEGVCQSLLAARRGRIPGTGCRRACCRNGRLSGPNESALCHRSLTTATARSAPPRGYLFFLLQLVVQAWKLSHASLRAVLALELWLTVAWMIYEVSENLCPFAQPASS